MPFNNASVILSTDKFLKELYAELDGVYTPNEPTLTTPLEPTINPLGETNMALPFANAPLPLTLFNIPLIAT